MSNHRNETKQTLVYEDYPISIITSETENDDLPTIEPIEPGKFNSTGVRMDTSVRDAETMPSCLKQLVKSKTVLISALFRFRHWVLKERFRKIFLTILY